MKMLLKKKIILTALILGLILTPALSFSQEVSADNVNDIIDSLDNVAGDARINVGSENQNIVSIVGIFINLFLSILGIIFLGLIIYSGIEWMMAEGNEEKVKRSRDRLTDAAIGVVIVLAAYLLTNYVIFEFIKYQARTP